MRNLKTSLFAAATCFAILTSCAPEVPVVAKSDIAPVKPVVKKEGATRKIPKFAGADKISVAAPSARLIANAASKPKDKHSMPIYTYGERNRIVRTTAYTCSEDDHLAYGSKNATGTPLRYSNKVRSAAADWSFYPVGTIFRISGMPQLFVIDDYGSALTGTGTIDLYKPSKRYMNKWGRRNVEITVVQWGSFKRSAKILAGRTKYAHCASMLANIKRQRPDIGSVASN